MSIDFHRWSLALIDSIGGVISAISNALPLNASIPFGYYLFNKYYFLNTLIEPLTLPIKMIEKSDALREKLNQNTQYFRNGLEKLGYNIKKGTHPIIPVMLGDALLAKSLAENLLEKNIYVVSFSFPVVPKEEARISLQISAAHTKKQLDYALQAFEKTGKKLKII